MMGLVLEGGAMRGMFTCGVTDVFTENGLEFDLCVGSSAGAVFGCNIKSRQPGRAIRYNLRFCRDKRYGTLYSLLRTGDIYDAVLCYDLIPDVYDPFDREAIKQNPLRFFICATDVETGRPVYRESRDGSKKEILWYRASASMPVVSRPVRVSGMKLLDGGISDPVPFRFAERMGCDKRVIILTQPKGFRKKKSPFSFLLRLMLMRYPKIAGAMEERYRVYNRQMETIEQLESEGRVLVIRPPYALGISRTEHDPAELERVYRLGRAEGEKYLERVKALSDNK